MAFALKWENMCRLLTSDNVRKMVEEIPPSGFGLRNRAILLMIFESKPSLTEIIHLRIDDVSIHKDSMELTLRDSDDTTRVVSVSRNPDITMCPVFATVQWLSFLTQSNIEDGPLFRAYEPHGYISSRPVEVQSLPVLVEFAVSQSAVPGFN